MTRNLVQALKAKIRRVAEEQHRDPQEIWTHLAMERFLMRLYHSSYREKFVLKGGVLLTKSVGMDRETRDIVAERLEHPHMPYKGTQVAMIAQFENVRIKVEIDLAFGDIGPEAHRTISLTATKRAPLFEKEVELKGYTNAYVFAEKLETVIRRGEMNSRMKDFHDLFWLTQRKEKLSIPGVQEALEKVFAHRKTGLRLPIDFNKEEISPLEVQWRRYRRALRKNDHLPESIAQVIQQLNHWLTANITS